MCLERFVFLVDLLELHTPTKSTITPSQPKGGYILWFYPPNLGLSSSAIRPRAWRLWRKPAKNLEPNPRSFRSPMALYLEVFVGHHLHPEIWRRDTKNAFFYNAFPFKYGQLLGIYVKFQGVVSGFQTRIPEAVPLSGTMQGVGKCFFFLRACPFFSSLATVAGSVEERHSTQSREGRKIPIHMCLSFCVWYTLHFLT